ncbi:MAG: DUF2290 domain-containing protein [Candidatus Eremiobacteraeota bacterium]|nr:DUF2290 domain-containing protein [Candidatus Eremiobacteraeota bacterium]
MAEWVGILKNANFCRSPGAEHIVTWDGYQDAPRIEDIVPRSLVADMARRGQYSFQMVEDDSIFQLQYEFNRRDTAQRARLAFYMLVPESTPDELDDATYAQFSEEYGQEDEEAPEQLETVIPRLEPGSDLGEEFVGAEDASAPWLRIDYDLQAARGAIHAPCHMHINGFSAARLPVNGVPSPRQFVDLILSLAYPAVFRRHFDNAGNLVDENRFRNLHGEVIRCERLAHVRYVTHLFVPGHGP